MEEPALPCANPNSVRFPVLVSETIIFQNAKIFAGVGHYHREIGLFLGSLDDEWHHCSLGLQ